MEASYFYYRPSDLAWEVDLVRGHYLDKGFNVKFLYAPKDSSYPSFALGLDDFAGTGYFAREYIASTYKYKNAKFSFGLGWGKFAGEKSFNNPLSFLSNKFDERPLVSDNFNLGGSPTYDQWFRGKSSIFGGIEYALPNLRGLKFKLELDPFNYLDFTANNRSDASYDLRSKDSNINFGISFPVNDYFAIDASYIKGNTFNISFNLALTLNDSFSKKPKFEPNIKSKQEAVSSKKIFYEELLENLNRNNLFLQTASLNKDNSIDITISNSIYRNAIRSSSYAAFISNEVAQLNNYDIKFIRVTHINAGVELNTIDYLGKYLENNNSTPIEIKIRNTKIDSGYPKSYTEKEFKPTIKFPVIFSSTSPTIFSHIGNPEKFYFGGVKLQNVSEIQFSRNLLLSSEINYSLYNNIQDTLSGPASSMQHVRSDLVQYLKEDDITIGRLQLDYIWSPFKDIYTKVSAGIFEPMYGGFGGEILYKPFKYNFTLGGELFYVKQRSFDQKFKFKKYKTTTGHINIGYIFKGGIESNLSFGRYLAKDDGYTFDIGRRTKSGFKAGIYFTRTNVPAELFGEGSFDKGFYFQIPMDIFSSDYRGNYSTFKLSPLTRDGGAKLIHDKDLKGLIYNSSKYELMNQWNGFLN
tara:strand:- start:3175 stop:5085 length:1911 start_codon:yes stop_codon:yes gene_type:complete